MFVAKLKGQITSDHQLLVEIPANLLPGVVEMILLQDIPVKPARRASRKSKHPAFGIWADRDDITDSAAFSEELRKSLQCQRFCALTGSSAMITPGK